MRGKIIFTIIATLGMLGFAVTPASAATPSVSISKVVYDSPGADNGSNASLNGEYVRLTNNTKKSINLYGYTLKDASGHRFNFDFPITIGAGKRVYVHTGKGTNRKPDAQHFYWGLSGYVWNNSGDTATLRFKSAKVADTCKWTKKGSGSTYC